MKRIMLHVICALMLSLLAVVPTVSAEDDFGGPEITFEAPVKGVWFSHKTHVGEFGLECDSCHDSIFQMQVGTALENGDFTMESLYQGKYCGACHDGSTAFASNTQCATCHTGVKGYRRATGGEGKGKAGH